MSEMLQEGASQLPLRTPHSLTQCHFTHTSASRLAGHPHSALSLVRQFQQLLRYFLTRWNSITALPGGIEFTHGTDTCLSAS